MKILHTIPKVGKTSAGPSSSVISLCESLQNSIEIVLASTDAKDIVIKYPFIKTFSAILKFGKYEISPTMHSWLNDTFSKKEFDLVHNHSLWLLQNLYPSWAASRFSMPIIISPRGTLSSAAMNSGSRFKKLYWKILQKPALRKATCFHATSEFEAKDIRRHGLDQPIILIPNGLDLPTISTKSFDITKPKKRLLFLGRIHPIKGLSNLIEAWGKFEKENKDWELEIAGPDSYGHLQELKTLSRNLDISKIIFSGEVTGIEKEQKFLNSNLFILPSHSENFGMVIGEALSYGLPCIASSGTPWKELMIKNAGWWTLNAPNHLLATIKEATKCSNTELKAMGQNGRNWIKEDFSLNKNAQKWLQAYKWILTNRNRPEFIYDK